MDIWFDLCGVGIGLFGCYYTNLTGCEVKIDGWVFSLGVTLGSSFRYGLVPVWMFCLKLRVKTPNNCRSAQWVG